MIVATVHEPTPDQAITWGRRAKKHADMLELRLDALNNPESYPKILSRLQGPFIITCRSDTDGGSFHGPLKKKVKLLNDAVKRGVEYVDVEQSLPISTREEIGGTQILSYHNHDRTPSDIQQTLSNMADHEPDHIKIATYCNTLEDSLRLMNLSCEKPFPVSLIGMGKCGLITRVLYRQSGSMFTYGAANPEHTTPPEQPPVKKLVEQYRIGKISPSTELYGLLGNPVSHSWSPRIFNNMFQKHEIDAVYIPLRMIQTKTVNKLLYELEFKGFSVTLPHKRTMTSFMDEMNPYAREIGAVNTVVRREGTTEGYNTDARAALESITENWPDDREKDQQCESSNKESESSHHQQKESALYNPLVDQNILILGAGGAARAALISLKEAGGNITITNRTEERGKSLAEANDVAFTPWEDRTDVSEVDLLVNATSVGMKPNEDLTPYPADALSESTVVFDMVYTPSRTKLLKQAKQQGCHTISGRDMFYRQARRQFHLWTGIPNTKTIQEQN